MNKPKLICLTPVKNEAWVLDAFLTAASLWADHIIVADQHSTDGSREIYKRYPKVIVVDNNDTDLHETNRQRLMFAEARKIQGDKVFIALDADEIFTANYTETEDWRKITHSKVGDVYAFYWAELDPTATKYTVPETQYQWAIFDDGTNPPEEGKIHIARVPWPLNSEPNRTVVKDFQVMHLDKINIQRSTSKERYYQCYMLMNKQEKSSLGNDVLVKNNPILSFRASRTKYNVVKYSTIPDYFFENYQKQGIDILKLVDFSKTFCWQDERVLQYFDEKGISFFRKLDIWDKTWLAQLSKVAGKEIKDPRKWTDKLVHFYLRKTQAKRTIFRRVVDRILKKIY